MTIDEQRVSKLMERFLPDQQFFAKSVASMRIENRVVKQQLTDLIKAYDELWKVMIVLLDAQPEGELRIHESQFLRFKEEYRIDRTWDEEKGEVVLRLLSVFDEPTK